jgi:hypothetical protein
MSDHQFDRTLVIEGSRESGTRRDPVPMDPFEAFSRAKVEVRAAEVVCLQTWRDTRSGGAVAWRRYRAALRRRERAIEALRHLDLMPRGR